MNNSVRIAVDIGGTFTDIQILVEDTGQSFAHKTPTTPEDPSVGLLKGIREASELFSFDIADVSALMHGTTIATNAVLQRRFPKAALLTTKGFEDVLEIGRHVRKEVYSQIGEERLVMVPRRYRFGVTERINVAGEVETALDEQAARETIEQIRNEDISVIAVCLLHSFTNPAHENRLEELINEQIPNAYVSISSRTSPQAREFERTSTTCLNALLMPVVRDYLDRLDARMNEAGFRAPVFLVQSNGGVTTPDIAREQPVRLVLSGPSGGAKAAETLSRQLDEPNLVAVDMGGTSFDVSVVENGATRLRSEGEIDGAPVRLPMLEIRTIGSGGGSMASADSTGRLTVGPQSAGAVPGPVAYLRGGTEPTVTDANLALGRIDPEYFLGGAMPLDADASARAVADRIASPLGLTPESAADGIVRIAISDMAEAIRLSLFEKGLDPADFALISFGGAGGLHTALVAEELGASRVLFPRSSGTLSAWGMLFADIVQDVVRSRLTPANHEGASTLKPLLADLIAQGAGLLERSGVDAASRHYELAFDMRYPGQGYELGVEAPDADLDDSTMTRVVERFHQQHKVLFAHNEVDVTPDIISIRLRAIGRLEKPDDVVFKPEPGEATKSNRRIYIGAGWHDVAVHERDRIGVGDIVNGPAIIEESHSTIVLPPNWTARVHPTGVIAADRETG